MLGSQWGPLSPRLFAWQAWHLATSTSTLAWQAWRLATSACTLRHRSPLGDIIVHFAWQAWHLRHSPGARGALRFQWTPLSPWLFAWQAWHLATLTSALRGTRGTWQHGPPRAGSGGALGSQWTPLSLLLFAWQAWQTVRVCNSVISFALRSGCVASPSRRMITSRH